jgi:cell division protein FtsI (penicillin-binding protein 3)
VKVGFDARAARWITLRIALIALAILVGFAIVLGRAVQLQVLERDRLGGLARDQYVREIELRPRRGSITDRNGVVLATDAPADSVFIDPKEFEGAPQAALGLKKLAKILALDARTLSRRVARGGHFVWAKRRISPAQSDAVRALRLPGVGLVKESRRYYPRRELAGQLLGFVGDDDVGLEGDEVAFDDALKGEPTTIPSLRDARGMQLFGDAPGSEQLLEGARLELTIEQSLQLAAENALVRAVAQSRAASGMVVVMDPRSGEVLALANAPTFNPNALKRGDEFRNRALLDTFEPGSTFKIFSIAGALDEGVLRPSDSIFCENGSYAIGGHVINDHARLGWVGPSRVLIASSNIGAAKIAERLGRERLQRTLQAFGFGERTESEIQGEPRGAVPYPRASISLAAMSFGQGVTATTLQITAAVAAIANGGMLMRPVLVRRLVDSATGRVLRESTPTAIRRAVSPATAAIMTRWLEAVVTDPAGTGKRARVPGWRVAGKTGTGQKADPVSGGYSAEKHFASFVGFAPADAPRIVIGVFIDEPKGQEYGGEIAAPVFAEIAKHALTGMSVPQTEPVAALPDAAEPREARVEPPVIDVPPIRSSAAQDNGEGVTVPALGGLSARAAVRRLESLELTGDLTGTGRVVNQVPRPGAIVEKGARVRLMLAPPG